MIQYKKITEQKEHYMTYERDLSFLKKALSYYRLSIHIIKDFEEHFEKVDKGIREFLGLDDLYEKTVSNIKEVKSRGAKVIIICKEGTEVAEDVADIVIRVPVTNELLMPMVTIVPLQLIAYYTAILRGNDVDMPHNLAKSVTVE